MTMARSGLQHRSHRWPARFSTRSRVRCHSAEETFRDSSAASSEQAKQAAKLKSWIIASRTKCNIARLPPKLKISSRRVFHVGLLTSSSRDSYRLGISFLAAKHPQNPQQTGDDAGRQNDHAHQKIHRRPFSAALRLALIK